MLFRMTYFKNNFITTKEYVNSLIEKDRKGGYSILVAGTRETPRIEGVDVVRTKEAFRRVLGLILLTPLIPSSNKKYDIIYNLTEVTPLQYAGVSKFISAVSNDYLVNLLTDGFIEISSNAWKNSFYK